jgi:hypothetical protein
MISFKSIELEDKKIITDYFRSDYYMNSECTFTNLYLWRKFYSTKWAIVDDFLVILVSVGQTSFIIPPFGDYASGDIKKVMEKLCSFFSSQGNAFIVRGVTEKFKDLFEKYLPDTFTYEEERDVFDYVYSGEKLRELGGRKLHRKRNHLKNFYKENEDVVYEKVTPEMLAEIELFLDEWYLQKAENAPLDTDLVYEKQGISDILSHMEHFDYLAAIMRINGKIEAFTIGESLNKDTVVIHIEKANKNINGLYGAINQQYLKNEWPDILYVNREEDTGDEGLRKAKLSYYPDELIIKYKGVHFCG